MSSGEDESDMMTLESVLDKFREDLIRRGRLEKNQEISQLDFAILLLDEYLPYPSSPTALIPINYCMLGKLYPKLDGIISLIC